VAAQSLVMVAASETERPQIRGHLSLSCIGNAAQIWRLDVETSYVEDELRQNEHRVFPVETSLTRYSALPRTHSATGALCPRWFSRVGECACSGVTRPAPNRAALRNAISTAPLENLWLTRSRSATTFTPSIVSDSPLRIISRASAAFSRAISSPTF